jgi:flagellar hook-associated protein 2
MADGMTVGGLASGLDTTSIINGLIQIEQQRVTRAEKKKEDIELKLATFNDLKTKLSDFYTQAKEMEKTTAFNVFSSTSSDEAVATITGESGATSGNYDVKVLGLASSLKVASKSFASSNTSLAMTGSFSLSVSAAALKADPSVSTVQVDITSTDTLKDIANKINRTKGSGATASVVSMGTNDYRLMITAVDEGSKAFTMEHVAGQGVLSNGLDMLQEATAASARESIRTDFDFRLAAGGPANAATPFSSLFNSIGSSSAITAGDSITIAGTRADGTAAAGTFTIGAPGTDTLQGLLTAVETAYGGAAAVGVSLNSSGEIIVTDRTLGTTTMAMTMTFNDVDVSGSKLGVGASKVRSDFKNVVADGKKAFYLMNEMSVSSQTNKDNATVEGTIFELKRVDAAQSVKLTLDYDKEGIKKKVQGYLDTYNQLLKFLDEKSKIEVKQEDSKTSSAGSKKTTIVKGPFAGDSSILGLKAQLTSMMTSKISELTDQGLSTYSSLASMGITSEQKTGFLTIKDEAFLAALEQDFEGVKRVFVTDGYMTNSAHTFGTYTKDTKTGVYDILPGGAPTFDTDKGAGTSWAAATVSGDGDILNSENGDSMGMAIKAASGSGAGQVVFVRGVAGQIRDFYDKINNYVDGFVTTTAKNYSERIKDEDTRISRLEKQVASVKERLTKQFANLELSISKLQSQSAAFSGQIKR